MILAATLPPAVWLQIFQDAVSSTCAWPRHNIVRGTRKMPRLAAGACVLCAEARTPLPHQHLSLPEWLSDSFCKIGFL